MLCREIQHLTTRRKDREPKFGKSKATITSMVCSPFSIYACSFSNLRNWNETKFMHSKRQPASMQCPNHKENLPLRSCKGKTAQCSRQQRYSKSKLHLRNRVSFGCRTKSWINWGIQAVVPSHNYSLLSSTELLQELNSVIVDFITFWLLVLCPVLCPYKWSENCSRWTILASMVQCIATCFAIK